MSKKIKNSVREYVDVPADLLIDIFSRVPTKSIARFRCVSKLWRSILNRSDFIDLFLAKSSTQPRFLFALEVNDELIYYSSPQPQNRDWVVATRYNTPPYPKYVPNKYSKTAMICGLMFRRSFDRKVPVICNHATGEFIKLPKVLQKDKNLPKVKTRSNRNTGIRRSETMYFGYDPIDKQFKVLCLTPYDTHRVLTLESGKGLWRTVECKFQFMEDIRLPDSVCINGVLYFGVQFQDSSSMIVCFDVRSENFSFVNIDKDMLDDEDSDLHGSKTLVNYKGKFGVHQCNNYEMEETMDFVLWILEDAVNHKWSKYSYHCSEDMYDIVRDNSMYIVGITETGDIVWSSYELLDVSFDIVYYNLKTDTFRQITIEGFEEFEESEHEIRVHTFLDYVENMKLFK